MRWLLLISLATACGTASQNSKTMAVAATAAAAITTAIDPDYAARSEEDAQAELVRAGVSRSVPADVFDRLDQTPLQ